MTWILTYNLISKPKTTILPKHEKNFSKLQENDKNTIFLYFYKNMTKKPKTSKFKAKKYLNKFCPFLTGKKQKNFFSNMEKPIFHKKSSTQNTLYWQKLQKVFKKVMTNIQDISPTNKTQRFDFTATNTPLQKA